MLILPMKFKSPQAQSRCRKASKSEDQPKSRPKSLGLWREMLGLGCHWNSHWPFWMSRLQRRHLINHSLNHRLFSRTRQIAWQLREDIKTIREGDTKELRRLPGITFLLERRHREHFGKEPDMVVNNSVVLNGTPKDMLSMMREAARGRLKEAPIEVESKKL